MQKKQSWLGVAHHFYGHLVLFWMRWKPLRFWAGKWYDQMYNFARITQSSDLFELRWGYRWEKVEAGRLAIVLTQYRDHRGLHQWAIVEVGKSHWILNDFEDWVNRIQWQNKKYKRRKSQGWLQVLWHELLKSYRYKIGSAGKEWVGVGGQACEIYKWKCWVGSWVWESGDERKGQDW